MAALKVSDVMVTEVVTLEEDEDLDLANTVMNLGRIRHLPVVNGSELVGLVTHRDILRAQVSLFADISQDEERSVRRSIRVTDLMTRDVHTVPPDETALNAAKLIYHEKVGCLPVVDDGKLVGIVTDADFVKLVIDGLTSAEAQGGAK